MNPEETEGKITIPGDPPRRHDETPDLYALDCLAFRLEGWDKEVAVWASKKISEKQMNSEEMAGKIKELEERVEKLETAERKRKPVYVPPPTYGPPKRYR